MTMKIIQEMPLPDGTKIVVVDVFGDKSLPLDEVNRNVYRLDSAGAVIWQIRADAGIYERSPFTGVHVEGGAVKANRWDGVEYKLLIDTGEAIPLEFLR